MVCVCVCVSSSSEHSLFFSYTNIHSLFPSHSPLFFLCRKRSPCSNSIKWLTARKASIWPCLSECHSQEPDSQNQGNLGDNWRKNLNLTFHGPQACRDVRLEPLQLSGHHRKFEQMQKKQSLGVERQRPRSAMLRGPLNNTAPQASCNPCILQFSLGLKPVSVDIQELYYCGTFKEV